MEIPNLVLTAQEQDQLERCYAILDEEQALQCEEEATEIAMREAHQEDAADLLVRTLARAIVRSVRTSHRQ